jgi:hypothetical protein
MHRMLAVLCAFLAVAFAARAEEGWISLFDGESLAGWTPKIKGYPAGENFANTFRAEDGVLKVSYDGYDTFDNRYGHIFYKTAYSHYRFRVEYRFVGEQVAGGAGWALRNSGIMLHCQPPETMTVDQEFPVSIEVQLLGGTGSGERTTCNMCSPGTHIVLNGQLERRHCINSESDTFDGDQWVTAEVEVRGDKLIRHFVNGKQVMEYTEPQLDPRDKDAAKLISGDNVRLVSGFIALQSESHPVEFRKIEILPLPEE